MSRISSECLYTILHIKHEILCFKTNLTNNFKAWVLHSTLTLFTHYSIGNKSDVRLPWVIIFKFSTKQSTIAPLSCSCEDMIVFDTQGLFWNVSYNRVHTNETTTLSRSWKRTPTEIRLSVSKLYVSFCGAATKLRARATVCWGSYFTHS
jgi:hypothetical protein